MATKEKVETIPEEDKKILEEELEKAKKEINVEEKGWFRKLLARAAKLAKWLMLPLGIVIGILLKTLLGGGASEDDDTSGEDTTTTE